MFSAFLSHYRPDGEPVGRTYQNPLCQLGAGGASEFFDKFSGVSFNNGLYRVVRADAIERWNEVLAGAFPEARGTIGVFAFDWLGRCFALSAQHREEGEPTVILFEPGTGEGLQIPLGFSVFHDEELVQQADAAVAEGFFNEWLASGGAAPRPDQCVGYKVPLFLGGQDTVENLELTDLGIYWEISSQLIAQIRDLPPGTPVKGVSLE